MCIIEHWNHEVGGIVHGEKLIAVAKLRQHVLVAILREEIMLRPCPLICGTHNILGTHVGKPHGGSQSAA